MNWSCGPRYLSLRGAPMKAVKQQVRWHMFSSRFRRRIALDGGGAEGDSRVKLYDIAGAEMVPIERKGRFPVSIDLSRLVPLEYSEVTRAFAVRDGLSYAALCARQALAPSPGEWGLLHCIAGPERTRVTLATSDMSYHRLLVQALIGPRDPADTCLPPSWSSRYAYGRYGWPDDWDPDSPGDPIPWVSREEGGMQEVGLAQAFLFSHMGPQVVEVSFLETPGGSRWSVLVVDRFSLPAGYGDLFVIDPDQARIDWIAARGVAVYPGWPTRELPRFVSADDVGDQASRLWRDGAQPFRWYGAAETLLSNHIDHADRGM
ncbi:hypothetical protein [Streptomyces graminofaciens]|nr:hypothetical protein [Streptomyces graminofaciens]